MKVSPLYSNSLFGYYNSLSRLFIILDAHKHTRIKKVYTGLRFLSLRQYKNGVLLFVYLFVSLLHRLNLLLLIEVRNVRVLEGEVGGRIVGSFRIKVDGHYRIYIVIMMYKQFLKQLM